MCSVNYVTSYNYFSFFEDLETCYSKVSTKDLLKKGHRNGKLDI